MICDMFDTQLDFASLEEVTENEYFFCEVLKWGRIRLFLALCKKIERTRVDSKLNLKVEWIKIGPMWMSRKKIELHIKNWIVTLIRRISYE